jgi:hypothetical protein
VTLVGSDRYSRNFSDLKKFVSMTLLIAYIYFIDSNGSPLVLLIIRQSSQSRNVSVPPGGRSGLRRVPQFLCRKPL